ncbi:MAG: hypothetical protein ACKN9W_04365 [Methylococcus sp.]
MTAQIKKYLTVRQLADRWKWAVEDVDYLLYEGLLWTTPKLAASNSKRDVRVVAVTLLGECTIPDLEAKYPNDYIEIATPEPGEADSEAEARMWRLLDADGDLERVITMVEVERVEREHPDRFAKPAIPEEEPDPVVHQAPPPASPELVKTPDMAAAFGRHEVNGWNSDDWKRELSDPAVWMKPAWTPSPGRPRPALWNPYLLATGVLTLNDSNEEFNHVDRAFADPELQAWQGEWQPYRDQWKGV